MARIFVSYRHADSRGSAGRLYDWLVREFEKENVYRDVDTERPHTTIDERIRSELANCDAFLAVVGPMWASDGRQDNWMRQEIDLALEQGIAPFLVLVDYLRPDELPAELAALPFPPAQQLRDDIWEDDFGRLARKVREALDAETLAPHCAEVARSLAAGRLVTVLASRGAYADAPLFAFQRHDEGEPIHDVLAALPGILRGKGYDPRLLIATSEPGDALESAFGNADEEYRVAEEARAASLDTSPWDASTSYLLQPRVDTTIVKLPPPSLGLGAELAVPALTRVAPALELGTFRGSSIPLELTLRLWDGDVLFLGGGERDPATPDLLRNRHAGSGSAWVVGVPPAPVESPFWRECGVEVVPGELAGYGRALRRQVEALPLVD
jgi:hypothetical protein